MNSLEKAFAIGAIGLSAAVSAGCGRSGVSELDEIAVVDGPNQNTPDGGIGNNYPDGGTDAGPDGSMGIDAGPDGSMGVGETQYLTRAELANALVNDILQVDSDGSKCTLEFPDTNASAELCRSANILKARGAMEGFPDGFWKPNERVNKAAMAKAVAQSAGFANYLTPECATKYPDQTNLAESWYGGYVGALCDRKFNLAEPDGKLAPGNQVTIPEWNTLRTQLKAYFNAPATRANVAEAVESVILGKTSQNVADCKSTLFTDIADQSLMCSVTQDLGTKGIISTSQPKFRPNDSFTYAELAKLYTVATGLTENPAIDCYNGAKDTWYYSYMNTLCQLGVLSPDQAAEDVPTVYDTYNKAWAIDAKK